MTDSAENRDALAAAILTSLERWRDKPGDAEQHLTDCEQLLSEYSSEESFRLTDLGNRAAEVIERSPEVAVDITLRISCSTVEAARALGCVLIARIGRFNPRTWISLIKQLADDEDAGVRDMTALIMDERASLQGWAAFHSDYVFSLCEEWRADSNYRLRRLVTRTLTGFASLSDENANRFLKLLEPLYEDSAEYVRRNVVSALREIGRKQSEPVFSFLSDRLAQGSPYNGELVPLILEGAFAHKHEEVRQDLLAQL
ncbi:MAG: HEAT repeat domain-containing protein [Calditrichaeota bacterium]|nr:HEAT repeat domain-containing protein [Calditrichota bacterium]MCB9391600.1 HEAT repeat domain-containing protein [Calditrichota bacterium]